MNVGVVSDIHGNLTALEAVLDAMPPVDGLVCCGDIVGYGPEPAECVERVRDTCDVVVQGNHDRNASSPNTYHNAMAVQGLQYAQDVLSHPQLRWLQNLPYQERTSDAVVVHSHPTTPEKRVLLEDYDEFVQFLEADQMLLFGHTHIQGADTVEGHLIVNPGSVGQPRDGDARAAFSVVDTDAADASMHRVEYDIDAVAQQITDAGLPQESAERLYRGV